MCQKINKKKFKLRWARRQTLKRKMVVERYEGKQYTQPPSLAKMTFQSPVNA